MDEEAAHEVWAVCRIPRSEVCYLRYTLEAHEGVCLPSTLPGREGRVRLLTSAGRADELARLLRELAREIPLEVEAWERG